MAEKLVRQKLFGAEIKWQPSRKDLALLTLPSTSIECVEAVVHYYQHRGRLVLYYYGDSFVNLIPFAIPSEEDVSVKWP